MASLVNYASSDEGEESVQSAKEGDIHIPSTNANTTNEAAPGDELNGSSQIQHGSVEQLNPDPGPDAPLVGPTLEPIADMETGILQRDETATLLSPFSANRALVRDLTLPTLPNYNIPPSPPGSPKGSTDAKFKHFLELKKQGIHFNQKLAKSSAVKNPSLMEKLMQFSDIDEAGQYESTLPRELWNPGGFPDHVYKEGLAKSQQKILKQREDEKLRGQRDSIEFAPASGLAGALNSNVTPAPLGKTAQKSASTAERIMAGLNHGRSNSPHTQSMKRKSRFDI